MSAAVLEPEERIHEVHIEGLVCIDYFVVSGT
jgi:hypothetical protein